MRKILILSLILLILIASSCYAATYFVDATGGSDAAAGSQAAPWKTISKVNASTFSGDDIIYFKKGGVWYETLIPPSSGTSGHQITFTSYGTGNKPIISGAIDASSFPVGAPAEALANADIETGDTTGWTITTGGSSTIAADNTDKHGGTWSIKLVRNGTNCNFKQTLTLTANSWYAVKYWYKKTAGTAANFQIYDSGSNFVKNDLVSYSASAVSLAGLTTDEASWTQHALVFKTGTDTSYTFRWLAAADATVFYDDFSVKKVQWEQVEATDEYKANVYQNRNMSLTKALFGNMDGSAPGLVWYNGTLLTIGTAGSLNAGECGWDNTGKTFNVNVGGSPSGLDIKIPWRGTVIQNNTQDYITVDGLDLRHTGEDANQAGAISAEDSASTNWVIQNCDIQLHTGKGIVQDTSGHATWTITNNSFTDIWNGKVYGSGGGGAAVYVAGDSGTVTKNLFNRVYTGIRPEGLGASVTYNVLQNIKVNGIDHRTDTSANAVLIYNNTVYHTPPAGWTGGHGISCQTSGHGANIFNNIVYSNAGAGATNVQAVALSNSNTVQANNNLLYATGASTLSLLGYNGQIVAPDTPAAPDGCSYTGNNLICTTIAGHKAAMVLLKDNATLAWTSDGSAGSAADTVTVGGDPLFISATDYRLKGGSGAINTGKDVSLTTDYLGRTVPRGSAPEIGAYEFYPAGGGSFGFSFGFGF